MYHFLQLTMTMAFMYANVHCQEHERVIMSGPVTKVVAPGEKTSFHCHARGDFVFWQIDKRCPYIEKSEFEARGFHFSYQVTELEEFNNTITVEALLSNNRTLISCIVLGWSNGELVQYAIQEGSLIIAAPPLAPSVDLNVKHVIDDTFLFTITWSTPFTWSGFPIISYNIIMTNYSGGVPITTTDTVTSNNTGSGYHQIYYTGKGMSGCYALSFSIEANNSLGKGESTLIHTGQPIDLEEISDIEIVITSLSSGVPHLWMSFLAPRICPGYQTGIYNITLFDDKHLVFDQFGPTKYTQENSNGQVLIVRGAWSGIELGNQYEVEVTVESVGVFRSKRKNFTAAYNNSGTCASHLPCSVTHDNKQTAVVSSSVGAAFLVVTFLLLMIIVLVVFYCHKKKRTGFDSPDSGPLPNRRRGRASTHKMEINPIYEGVLYETTPGESFKPLLNDPSESRISGATSDCTPHYARASPNLPPPRTQLIDSCCEFDTSGKIKSVTMKPDDQNRQFDNDHNVVIKGRPGNSTSVIDGKVWFSNHYETYSKEEEEKYVTL